MLGDDTLRKELLQLRELLKTNSRGYLQPDWVPRCSHLYNTYGREVVNAEIDKIMKENQHDRF